jgi:glycosyltransferase involved in cell wall biosynthesis
VRIVHVLTSLELGGMETMVLNLADYQKSKGHTVSIVTIYRMGGLSERAQAKGIDVFCVEKRDGKDVWSAIAGLRSLFKKQGAQIVHTHNLVPHYLAAAACVGLKSCSLINTRHDMGEHLTSRRGDVLYRLAMLRTSFWVAVCKAAARQFVDRNLIPAKKSEVIVNGIELAAFKSRSKDRKTLLLSELGVAGSPLVFGSIGRLNKVKNLPMMLAAFDCCVRERPDSILVIAGDGPTLAESRAAVLASSFKSKVFFLGSRADVPNLLQGFDVFLQSSLTEGYSLALVEACACALPIVATSVGGNAEIIHTGVRGQLVAVNDIKGFASAMTRFAGDENLRHAIGTAAQRWALEFGSIATMYERYFELYEQTQR